MRFSRSLSGILFAGLLSFTGFGHGTAPAADSSPGSANAATEIRSTLTLAQASGGSKGPAAKGKEAGKPAASDKGSAGSDKSDGKSNAIKAADLAAELIADREQRKKYEGQPIEVIGTVRGFDRSLFGEDVTINLESAEDLKNFRVVTVGYKTPDNDDWKKVKPGQTVRVSGTFKMLVDPIVTDAKVLEITGEPLKPIAAKDLLKMVKDNGKGADKKYKGMTIPVTGVISKVTFNEAKAAEVTLKTAKGLPELVCSFPAYEHERTKAFKAGQSIKAYGRYNNLAGSVLLTFCLVNEEKP